LIKKGEGGEMKVENVVVAMGGLEPPTSAL
jgi:hypothetical protein